MINDERRKKPWNKGFGSNGNPHFSVGAKSAGFAMKIA
jgi:hypothetical protein